MSTKSGQVQSDPFVPVEIDGFDLQDTATLMAARAPAIAIPQEGRSHSTQPANCILLRISFPSPVEMEQSRS